MERSTYRSVINLLISIPLLHINKLYIPKAVSPQNILLVQSAMHIKQTII